MKKIVLLLVLFFSMGFVFHPTHDSSQILLEVNNTYGVSVKIDVYCDGEFLLQKTLKGKSSSLISLPKICKVCTVTTTDWSLF